MASSVNSTKKRLLRFSDVAQEPLETLISLNDYETCELVSLEASVVPLKLILPDIMSHVKEAKNRYSQTLPSEGLTVDQAASIYLYTEEWEPREQSLYVVLNATLRSKERTILGSWLLYVRLLLTALSRLESTRRFLYRGVKSDLHNAYSKDQIVTWWGFSSCTTTIEILDDFLGKTGKRTIFTIDCKSGKTISSHSAYLNEKEVLLLPETQFRVIASLDQGNELYMIQLEEIQSPFCISQPTAALSGKRQTIKDSDSISTFPKELLKEI